MALYQEGKVTAVKVRDSVGLRDDVTYIPYRVKPFTMESANTEESIKKNVHLILQEVTSIRGELARLRTELEERTFLLDDVDEIYSRWS